jgi:phosphohistidine phosphatase
MKTLLLIRHAKSDWKHLELSDFDRPLNQRGLHDAPLMAKRLQQRGIRPDCIISSPAIRALTTAQLFADGLKIGRDIIKTNPQLYMAQLPTAIETIHDLNNDWQTALLVGHNPYMTELANFLSNCYVENIPTCGIFCIQLTVDSWSDVTERAGKLMFFDYPKQLPL